MKKIVLILFLLMALAVRGAVIPQIAGPANPPATAVTRFGWVDVTIDSGKSPLGAYQFELTLQKGHASIVGLEGGEAPAFSAAPYYDPAALKNSRVIVAAYSTVDVLPAGKTRVARVMIEITAAANEAEPAFTVKLIIAVDKDGHSINATADFSQGAAQ